MKDEVFILISFFLIIGKAGSMIERYEIYLIRKRLNDKITQQTSLGLDDLIDELKEMKQGSNHYNEIKNLIVEAELFKRVIEKI